MAYPQGEVIVPVMNINGSSGDDLREKYYQAMAGVATAIEAMQESAPHGRDYQTEKASVYREARDQHQRRLKILAEMHQDMALILMAVQDQIKERRRT